MDSTNDTPRARQLGAELRKLRLAAGLSTADLGRKLGHAHTHISRWENGRLLPSEGDLATALYILAATKEQRKYLLALRRDAADPNWLSSTDQLALYAEYERTAKSIIDVQPMVVPGLLQTADYTRALLLASDVPDDEVEDMTTARLARKPNLTRRRVAFTTIVGEYALRFAPCSDKALVEQLRYLIKMAVRDNVNLQVLPLHHRCGAGLTGPFVLMEFERAKPTLHLEHYVASSTLTDPAAIRAYRYAADRLRTAALSPQDSGNLIADIIGEVEAKHDGTALA